MQPHFLLLLSALQHTGLPAAPFQKWEVLPNYVLPSLGSGSGRQERVIYKDPSSLASTDAAEMSKQEPAPWPSLWGYGTGDILIPQQERTHPGSCHIWPCHLELLGAALEPAGGQTKTHRKEDPILAKCGPFL